MRFLISLGSRRVRMNKIALAIIAIVVATGSLHAQTLTHKRLTISSGGGWSSDGTFNNQMVFGQTSYGKAEDSVFFGGGGFLGGGDDWLVSIEDETIKPSKFELSQNYPNPFNPQTTIEYSLAEPGRVRLEVFNILGQRLAVLVDEFQEAGYHKYLWNAADIPSGVYFYRIGSGDYEMTRKMLLLK